jgi:DNA-binding MarR family transcriptional regulator
VRRAQRPRRESRRPSDLARLAAANPQPPVEEASLALSAWIQLLRAHGLVLREIRRRLPSDLTLPQFDVLAQLHRHPDGLLPSELTRALLVTAGNVTGIVRRLEGLGLVERLSVPHDRRAVRVRLTEKGRARAADVLPEHARALEAVFARVPGLDVTGLRERLLTLARGLDKES